MVSVTMNSISIKLTGNEDRHKISDKFELRPDLINHFGVTCPVTVPQVSDPCPLGQLVTCNEDRHKISDKFNLSSNLELRALEW